MTFEDEKHIFYKAWEAYEDGYFLSSTPNSGWAVFFKVEEDIIYMYSLKSGAWATDVPDQRLEQLEHIVVKQFGEKTLSIEIDGQVKNLVLRAGSAKHYWGR